MIEEYFGDNTTGEPNGHGFANAPMDPLHPDDEGNRRVPATTRSRSPRTSAASLWTPSRYSLGPSGQIPDTQFRWIEQQLKKNSKVYYNQAASAGGTVTHQQDVRALLPSPLDVDSIHEQPTEDTPPRDASAPLFRAVEECAPTAKGSTPFEPLPERSGWVNGHSHGTGSVLSRLQKAPTRPEASGRSTPPHTSTGPSNRV